MSDKEITISPSFNYDLIQTLFIELVCHLEKQGSIDIQTLSKNLLAAADEIGEIKEGDQNPDVALAIGIIARALQNADKKPESNPDDATK